MDLSEKEWDEAKQFGQYLLEQGESQRNGIRPAQDRGHARLPTRAA